MPYYVTVFSPAPSYPEETIGTADSIASAKRLLVDHLREEAQIHHEGPLYALSADHIEKHWPDDRTGPIDVDVGVGIADEHLERLTPDEHWRHVRDLRVEGCPSPNYRTYAITDDPPGAAERRARGDFSNAN